MRDDVPECRARDRILAILLPAPKLGEGGPLGKPDAVDCALRIYVARNAYRIARPDDLLNALDTVFPNARDVLARYGAR